VGLSPGEKGALSLKICPISVKLYLYEVIRKLDILYFVLCMYDTHELREERR